MGEEAPQKKSKLDKLVDYKNWKFSMNWSTAISLFGAITWAVTVTIQNQGLKATIDGQGATIEAQGTTITALTNNVSTLEGSMETVNNTIRAFTENPPSALEAKIDGLNRVIQIYHGSNALNDAHNTPTPVVIPDSIVNTMGDGGTPVQPPN